MSRYNPYRPNERIVDRACFLWVAMLANPKYDNLGENSPESPDSIASNTMASMLTSMLHKNNTPDVLNRFSCALKKRLMNPRSPGEDYYISYLSVDYRPDGTLADAAKESGLEMEFPWKTSMHLTDTYVYVSNGYAAPQVYHYPLSGDRWLKARLSGDDMPTVIALVEAGILDINMKPLVAV